MRPGPWKRRFAARVAFVTAPPNWSKATVAITTMGSAGRPASTSATIATAAPARPTA